MAEQSTLIALARAVKNAPMRERYLKMAALRDYVRTHTEAALVSEIERLDDASLGGTLVGAGLGARAQDALIKRSRELQGA